MCDIHIILRSQAHRIEELTTKEETEIFLGGEQEETALFLWSDVRHGRESHRRRWTPAGMDDSRSAWLCGEGRGRVDSEFHRRSTLK
jgi:hypothetical protein